MCSRKPLNLPGYHKGEISVTVVRGYMSCGVLLLLFCFSFGFVSGFFCLVFCLFLVLWGLCVFVFLFFKKKIYYSCNKKSLSLPHLPTFSPPRRPSTWFYISGVWSQSSPICWWSYDPLQNTRPGAEQRSTCFLISQLPDLVRISWRHSEHLHKPIPCVQPCHPDMGIQRETRVLDAWISLLKL